MHLYKIKPQFDPDTGSPSDPILKVDNKRAICDFSGVEYDIYDSDEHIPTYNISIHYSHSSEPNWYEEYHKFETDFGVTYETFAELMESPYHFMHTEEYGCADYTEIIAAMWLDARGDIKGPKVMREFKQYGTIEQMFLHFRLKNLRKLLTEKRYTPQQLGLEVDPQFDPEFNKK